MPATHALNLPPTSLPRHAWAVLRAPSGTLPAHAHWALGTPSNSAPVQATLLCDNPAAGAFLRVDTVTSLTGHQPLFISPMPLPSLADPVLTTSSPNGITLANAALQAHLSPARGIQLTAHQTPLGPFNLAYTSANTRFSSANDTQASVTLIEPGPIRALARWQGRCLSPTGQPGLALTLDIELFASLSHAVVRAWFIHDLPGLPLLDLSDLTLTLPLPGFTQHHTLQLKRGIIPKPHFVSTTQPLHAAVGHDNATAFRLLDPAPLQDPTVYPDYLMPPCDEIAPWLAMSSPLSGITCAATLDDLRESRPNALCTADQTLSFNLWPSFAGTLSLPQGRSRSATLRLAFSAQSPDPASITKALAVTSPEPLLSITGQAPFFDTSLLLQSIEGRASRFDDFLKKVACPPTVADKFDLGDTPDPGYQTTYIATARRIDPIVPAEQLRPIQFTAGGHFAVTPWSDLSQYEQVWANNEYDVIWCIASEALRCRQADLLRPLRWYARHAIEVDFVHHSDHAWKHRCTPAHSARHTTTGAYPSHFWTEGVLAHYLLTGDPDALSFARAIGDKIIDFFSEPDQITRLWHPTRELGWALVATAALAQVDPQEKYLAISEKMASQLIQAPLDAQFTTQMVQFSFGFASILLGLDRWHQVRPSQQCSDWIVDAATRCSKQVRSTPSVAPSMTIAVLWLGYKHSGDESLLRAGMHVLERMMDTPWWHSPAPYAKPAAMLHRPLARFFESARQKGLLTSLDYRF
jgi:hypothetical protein